MEIRDYFSSPRVRKFVLYATQAKRLLPNTEDGIPVVVLEKEDRLHILLEVGMDATQESLRKAVTLALQWRDLLAEQGGYEFEAYDANLISLLVYCHNQGMGSYRQLATICNQVLASLLYEYSRYKDECKKHGINHQDPRGLSHYGTSADPKSYGMADILMEAMGFPFEERRQFLDSGMENIENGYPPFLKDQPISRNKVRDRLRPYKSGAKKVQTTNLEQLLQHPLCRMIFEGLR